jgi:hypothetical protein
VQYKKELEELKQQLAPKKKELPAEKSEITYKHRTPLRTLFGSDEGVSYIGSPVCVCGWVKTVR